MEGVSTTENPSPQKVADEGNLQDTRRRLLIISADFPPTKSAEADHAYHLSSHFARRGTEVTVLTTATPHAPPMLPGVTVAAIMPHWTFAALPRLVRFLRKYQPDAILLLYLAKMYDDYHPMITFAPTLARGVIPRAAFVTQIENYYIENTNSLVAKALRKVVRQWITGAGTDYYFGTLLRDSRKVIVLSEFHLERLRRDHCTDIDERSVLIPPAPIMNMCPANGGLARDRGRAALGIAEDELVISYYGYVYPGKGIETMLRAFATVSKGRPKVRLLAIGGFLEHARGRDFGSWSRTYETNVMELASSLGIRNKITWTGHCPSTEVEGSRYLWASDICVLPFDGGVHLNNSSFAAAVAHRLPILTTAGSRVDSPIVDGSNVLLSPPKDAEAMAQAMVRLVENSDLRRELARGTEALAREWFDWDRVIERITATFSESKS